MTYELVPIGDVDDDLEVSWGIGTMGEFGDLFANVLDFDTRMPRFPDMPDDAEFGEDSTGKQTGLNQSGAAYLALVEKTRSTPGTEGEVPAFKFRTNDWWRVSEEETRILAMEAARLIADGDADGWHEIVREGGDAARRRWNERLPKLLAFLTACSTTGGFQVA